MTREAPARLTDAQRLDWLRLIRSENIGPRTFWALLARYGSAAQALAALPDLARRGGAVGPIRVTSRADAQRELDATARHGVQFLARGEPDYPAALATIDSVPPLIAVKGELAALRRPMVAIVGSRNASAAGLTFADRLAGALAQAGFVIVSGLARGIDGRAHQAALDAGTVAVLPGGHDRIYPPEHALLAQRIVAAGVVLTEMPLGWDVRGKDFPRRNRIVAGLALGTVVIEAARRSGSLITARLANEQGREVFAVPGSPLDPRAEGTNDLLRQGATLCTRPEDVIDALQPRLAPQRAARRPRGLFEPTDRSAEVSWPDPDRVGDDAAAEPPALPSGGLAADGGPHTDPDIGRRIAALLGPSPIGIDEMARAVGVPARHVHEAVLELELAGRLSRHAGNLISRPPER